MFLDDIKLFENGTKEIDTLIQVVSNVLGDINIEIKIKKCSLINIEKGKVTISREQHHQGH